MATPSEKKVQHFGRTNGEVSGKYTRDRNPTFAQGGRKGETRTCAETPGPDPKAFGNFSNPATEEKKIVFSRKFLIASAAPLSGPRRGGPSMLTAYTEKDGSFLGMTDPREFCFSPPKWVERVGLMKTWWGDLRWVE